MESPPESGGPAAANAIAANLAIVRARMAAACARAGRAPSEVRLLPVTKTVPAERLRAAAGLDCFGENKVQEAKGKAAALADLNVRWSIIGHLQTNKAGDILKFADEFQALDSLRLAEALDRRLQSAGRGLDVLVQVNTSDEPSKFGLPPDEVPAFARALAAFGGLRVRGLMTLAEFTPDQDRVRACFRRLRAVQTRLRDAAFPPHMTWDALSMGMSGDFETAIEEGATVVRVGQAIFGARALPDSHYWPENAAG